MRRGSLVGLRRGRIGVAMAILLSALGCAPVHAGLVWDATERVLGMGRGLGEVEVAFNFRVEGAEVSIWKVETDCSCAKASVAKGRFAVGERGEVRVRVKFPPAAGRHRKEVIVWTDDMSAARQALTLVGLIDGPALLRPAVLTWRVGEAPAAKWLEGQLPGDMRIGDGVARVTLGLFDVRVGAGAAGGMAVWEVVPRQTSLPGRSVVTVDLPREAIGTQWTLVAVAEVR